MKTSFTEEQQILQQSVKKFFEKEVTPELVRSLQEADSDGHCPMLWKKIIEAGWHTVFIPEQYGGAGGTLLDQGVIYEEAGKVLLPTTFYSTVHAVLHLLAIGNEQQKHQYLELIVDGNLLSTVAYEEPHAINDTEHFMTTATKNKDGWVLNGKKILVANANTASIIFVVAKTNSGLGVFAIEREQSGVGLIPHSTIGRDRQFVIELQSVQVSNESLLGDNEQADALISLVRQQATGLQCLEMAGGANKVLRMTVDYVKERKQFGVAIGSFQAVQHHLSNMYTKADGAKLLAYKSISLLSEGSTASREVHMAKAFTSKAYKDLTIMAHQLWGGMGYATESPLFLWSNRAKATELSFGSYDYHMHEIGKRLAQKESSRRDEHVIKITRKITH